MENADATTAGARRIIAALKLDPLPREGGFFRPTWRGPGGSAILYLMTPLEFSALHRLPGDELWHFHAGDAVELVQLDPRDATVRVVRLGPDVLGGEIPQHCVPGGVWQGARPAAGGGAGWSLVGCTLAPAWVESQFELGSADELIGAFPAAAALIRALTR